MPAPSPFTATPAYQRHRPEQTALYSIVSEHYPCFVQEIERAGGHLAGFVRQEFEDYLQCGLLEHGFLGARAAALPVKIPVVQGTPESHRKQNVLKHPGIKNPVETLAATAQSARAYGDRWNRPCRQLHRNDRLVQHWIKKKGAAREVRRLAVASVPGSPDC